MIEDADEFLEQAMREAWAASGLEPRDLPPTSDPRMQRILGHLRSASRKLLESEVASLRQREAALEQRIADIEERVLELEAHAGLGGVTLQ